MSVQEQRARVTRLVVESLAAANPRQLFELERALVAAKESVELRRLEVENFERQLLLAERVAAETIPGAKLRWSRQRLEQLRKAGRLVALRLQPDPGYRYPIWQFDRTGQVHEGVARLLDEAQRGGLSALELHLIMTNAAAGGGVEPTSLLARGEVDAVCVIVRASGDDMTGERSRPAA